jgi:hypothetical protein
MRLMLSRSAIVAALIIMNIGAPRSPAAQTTTSESDKLQPLAFLAGSCWKGTFTGRTVTDEHCFQWIMNGRFLRDHHVVSGDAAPYEGETTYAWDPVQKRITYWYIALPGYFSQGNVEAADSALVFHDSLALSTPQQLRSTWRRSGADSYSVRVDDVTGGKSKEAWSMVMQRTRPAP